MYLREKAASARVLVGTFSMVRAIYVYLSALTSFVWYALGIAIVLFFQCMAALFNPVYRRGESIKWGLVFYTVVVFSFVTVFTAINLNVKSNSFVGNRQFTDPDGTVLGPLGYQTWFRSNMSSITSGVVFPLTHSLADTPFFAPHWCSLHSPGCLTSVPRLAL